jgi:hypothetical protein
MLTSGFSSWAQEVQVEKARKNTVKIDITSLFLYRKSLVFSYERVLRPNQTLGIIAGYQQFPQIVNFGSNISLVKEGFSSGFKFGAEYRFYLPKENKYAAPHGVYLGPYFTILNFRNERTIQVDNNGVLETAEFTSKIGVINVGVQLGYQFVIKDRLTIDLSFIGPSISNYNAEMQLNGNFSFDQNAITNEIIANLTNRFPGLADLMNGKVVASNGKVDTWAFGYRYQFQVGYHFGRRK